MQPCALLYEMNSIMCIHNTPCSCPGSTSLPKGFINNLISPSGRTFADKAPSDDQQVSNITHYHDRHSADSEQNAMYYPKTEWINLNLVIWFSFPDYTWNIFLIEDRSRVGSSYGDSYIGTCLHSHKILQPIIYIIQKQHHGYNMQEWATAEASHNIIPSTTAATKYLIASP